MIQTVNMCRTYKKSGSAVRALTDINICVEQGEFAVLSGASGSGKSTLMNILGFLDMPDSGSYFFDGEDVCGMSDREISRIRNRMIGFVFQSFNLITSMTAVENVCLPLEYRGVPRKECVRRACEALEMVGLSHRIDHKPYELSGGQQQRVAIARALAAEPQLILADEPCGNLDSKAGGEIMRLLCELNRAGKTLVLITHDENAVKMGDRVIRIKDGRVNNQ
ncbi:MAG: ABC transporter ATP-binding protein [Eubacterium sp.]|nr:ABC transporter ATP-binding protein [Eubacterium sp.]